MFKVLFVFTLLLSTLSFSQEHYNSEGFDVTLDDVLTSTYTKDSTANALVIYEDINTYADIDVVLEDKFYFKKEIRRKIKILNPEGLNNAKISIKLYNAVLSSETVENIQATTHNALHNSISKSDLNPEYISRTKQDKSHSIIQFTLPDVKVGSVLTYSYTIVSPYMVNLKGWQFQEDIPKLYSKYSVSYPENYEYRIKLYGDIFLTDTDTKITPKCFSVYNTLPTVLANSPFLYMACSKSYYTMKDIPAFKPMAFMTTKHDALARIEYELYRFRSVRGKVTDYSKYHKTLNDEIKKSNITSKHLLSSTNIDDLLPFEITTEANELKRAEAIYLFIQNNYTCNGKYNIENTSLTELLKNKSGDVLSINLLLLNVLKEAKIEAKPVLLSTRNNGLASKLNTKLSNFDYLIVQTQIKGKTYLLDASNAFLNFNELPFRCLNQYGLLIDKKGNKWIGIDPETQTKVLYNVSLNLDDHQSIKGQIESKKTGYHALNEKQSYFKNNEKHLDSLKNEFPNASVLDYSVKSIKTQTDFHESYNIEFNTNNTNSLVNINPFIVQFIKENPLKSEERIHPIDFGFKDTFIYMLQLNFNHNYKVKNSPKETIFELPNQGGTIALSSKVIGNSVNVFFKINFNQTIYKPEYYQSLKEFMNKIIEIQNNSNIILERK